jgi:hypothetical protein
MGRVMVLGFAGLMLGVGAVVGVFLLLWYAREVRGWWWQIQGRCGVCGYERGEGKCPECGEG